MKRLTQYGLVYLATPYRKYPRGLEMAFYDATMISGILTYRFGVKLFCPITHGHPMTKIACLPADDHKFWMEQDRPFMERSDALVVARMEGWDKSEGVAEEISFFRSWNRPVFHLDPENMEIVE